MESITYGQEDGSTECYRVLKTGSIGCDDSDVLGFIEKWKKGADQ